MANGGKKYINNFNSGKPDQPDKYGRIEEADKKAELIYWQCHFTKSREYEEDPSYYNWVKDFLNLMEPRFANGATYYSNDADNKWVQEKILELRGQLEKKAQEEQREEQRLRRRAWWSKMFDWFLCVALIAFLFYTSHFG